jgi:ankyrin repeat protein
MSKLSGIRDLDREILCKIDDIDLLNTCSIDRYTWFTVCDDSFLKRRLLKKYPEIARYKKKTESWKQFFSRAIHYISKMKEKYNYDYSFGNFAVQCDLLNSHVINDTLLYRSSERGELALVIWSLKLGADIHYNYESALGLAIESGHLDIVKYLVENGANFKSLNSYQLGNAVEKGHLEIVKYLVEIGSDIHAYHDLALRLASSHGHLEIVKYLVEVGADIHALNDIALGAASRYGYLEIVKYLVEIGANIRAQDDYALKCAIERQYYKIVEYLNVKIIKNVKMML